MGMIRPAPQLDCPDSSNVTTGVQVQLSGAATIPAIEAALRGLAAGNRQERLKLPMNIRHVVGGGEAALTQLAITWAQTRPDPILETFIESEQQVTEFVRRLTGLVASLCSVDTLSHRGGGSISEAVRSAALARLAILQSGKPSGAFRGSSVEIPCVDHLGKDSPYLLCSSAPGEEPRLRPRSAFTDLAAYLLGRTVPEQYQRFIDTETPDALGSMIFELFKNTQDHGQVDDQGNMPAISVRAIKTMHYAIRTDHLQDMVSDYPALARFCETLRPPRRARQTHLFELSVLDSGPGFAVSRLHRPLSEITREVEEAAVRECFTEFSSKGSSRFGQGLPHVLRLLARERGFLRLRTGRVSLHADFSDERGTPPAENLESYVPDSQEQLAPVSGSLMTVLIPLRRDE